MSFLFITDTRQGCASFDAETLTKTCRLQREYLLFRMGTKQTDRGHRLIKN